MLEIFPGICAEVKYSYLVNTQLSSNEEEKTLFGEPCMINFILQCKEVQKCIIEKRLTSQIFGSKEVL